MIDTGNYTQSEIAKQFGISQGTVSHYHRNIRMKLRSIDYSKIIARQNEEILELKSKLCIRVELIIPKSFYSCKFCCINKSDDYMYCFISIDKAESINFTVLHPEYTFYVLKQIKGKDNLYKLSSNSKSKNKYVYLISKKDFGYIRGKDNYIVELSK